jgi:hypothetical protein
VKQRIRDWINETHGTQLELVRHFSGSFFSGDSGLSSDGWLRVAGGAGAAIVSLWILLAPSMIRKYSLLRQLESGDRIRQEFSADQATLSMMCVFATMLLAGVLWQSLYPGQHDYHALAGFPIRQREIFAAKFSTLVLLFAAFAGVIAFQAAAVLYLVAGGPPLPHQSAFTGIGSIFAAIAGAAAFAFFGLVALQGLMLNLFSRRVFQIASALLQALATGTAVAGFAFAGQIGSFVTTLPLRHAWLYALGAPLSAVLIYALSYHRYSRLVVEASRPPGNAEHDWLERAIELWIRCPREQAAFLFMMKTIGRSRVHWLACLIYGAVAVAWVVKNAVDATSEGASPADVQTLLLVSTPLTLLVFTLLGARFLFTIPAELRANWLFQITEREGRLAWMKAVERFAIWIVVFPLVLVSTIFVCQATGKIQGIAWSTLAILFAGSVFEYVFCGWRKLPFTCSQLVTQKPLIMLVAIGVGILGAMVPSGMLLMAASRTPILFLAALGVEITIWRRLRKARLNVWGMAHLHYQDRQENIVSSLESLAADL